MATLIEEINIRIALYGGRRVLVREIEKEWNLRFINRNLRGGNKAHPIWTQEEKKILRDGITEISEKINRSRAAIYIKALKENLI